MAERSASHGGVQAARTALRGRLQLHPDPVQVLLALVTVVAVSSLVFSGIRYGLLAQPDMGIAGPGSGGNTFAWFQDQIESVLPSPTVISVPMWIYRLLMFAWAFWIALALARWLRFAWHAWTARGFWRGKVVATG